MRLPVLFASVGIAALVALSVSAQSPARVRVQAAPPEQPAPNCPDDRIEPAFRNLDFSLGNPGERPPGWNPFEAACYLPPNDSMAVEIVSGHECYSGQHCAVIKFVPNIGEGDEVIRYIRARRATRLWFLHQVVDVTPYRGKTLTFRAAVRAAVSVGGEARLLVRVHRDDSSTSFFDDMGKFPVRSSAWHIYEIQAPIDREAGDVEFGMQLIGQGEAWIDHISMDFTGPEK